MKSFVNRHKEKFIASIPIASIDADADLLTNKCKFNFAYFDVQPASQSFEDWTEIQRKELFSKLQVYSREPLKHWKEKPIGRKNGNVLSIYGAFPPNSDFKHPKHVPHEVEWGRFRLDCSCRLVGFVVPKTHDETMHKKTGKRFDCNTFYIVFLDADHRFYKSKESK